MRLQVRQSKHIRIGNDSTTSVGFKRQIYVPKLNQRMSNALPTRTGRLSVVLLAVGWSLLCAFAPWQQVHPSDNSLVQELSRAPLWTSHYRGLPGSESECAGAYARGLFDTLCSPVIVRLSGQPRSEAAFRLSYSM